MNPETILWELLFGSIGFAMFVYGKKQKKNIPLGCGVALIILPYLITQVVLLVLVGLALVIAPFIIKR